MWHTTATATEKREEDGEVTQRSPIRVHRKRQNTGDLNGVRERSFRSQTGRSAPSPEKRRSPASSRGVQGRGMPQQRRNVGPPNGPRRGPSENGVRRSNSPAKRGPVDARRNVRNRSPAAREVEKPGNQSPARNAENEGSSSKTEKPKEEVSPVTGESLENPLVLMECFIFRFDDKNILSHQT
ncbi:pre-mRNA-splicing factor CWC22-like [Solanum lycopersicum]|uniref:pre-mRNA-splicing factor CWC22-like n=1 Tax=Solanum lycopersicum TaxID=4081 RepID=UPI0037496548